jgi:hypothetical protein
MSVIKAFLLDEHWQGGVTVRGAELDVASKNQVNEFQGETSAKRKPRLPHYVTPDRLRRDGYTDDMIKALNPLSTPIAYQDAYEKNAQARKEFEAKPENANRDFTPPYHPGRRIVRGTSDPQGGATMVRFHKIESRAEGEWHASPYEMELKLGEVSRKIRNGLDVRTTVTRILDLDGERDYVSDATLKPGMYDVELSFTLSRSQQAKVDPENVDYGNTRKTKDRYKPKP